MSSPSVFPAVYVFLPAGPIPPTLRGLKSLTYLGLYNNKLTGMYVTPLLPCFALLSMAQCMHVSRLLRALLIPFLHPHSPM